MLTDIQIAQAAAIQPIVDIAAKLQISPDDLELFGKYKAKLPLEILGDSRRKPGKLILVTALTPTPAGEGKTTTTIGLVDGLNRIGMQAVAVLREPSLGPVFGMKGGAAGGGYSQVIPMEDINLHFTGDFNAVEKANNLLAALIDNNLQSKSRSLELDPRTILWKRVMDMNDRALRNITIGLGGTAHGIPRETGFNITPASEVMAILCMSSGIEDLKNRLGNILVGYRFDKTPVFARDLNAEGAMAILLKDAIKPNLVQTLEGNPAILHGGPFANIAQGTNTILATKMGLTLADYAVTEAGFGADLGAEKFMHLKCVAGDLSPAAVVVVATIRALRHHGGIGKEALSQPNSGAVEAGFANLQKHLENMQLLGLRPVVAINAFPNDSEEEVLLVQKRCREMGVEAVVARGFAEGGQGMQDLARAVVAATEQATPWKPLLEEGWPIRQKIETLATQYYGAVGVDYTPEADRALMRLNGIGLGNLPVCMAKTEKSFSDNPDLRGRPVGFRLTVRDVEVAAGAGFAIPILGTLMRMPGLPVVPAAEGMTIDGAGKITGLS
jgi:formate--tetrahydrofolate ligase